MIKSSNGRHLTAKQAAKLIFYRFGESYITDKIQEFGVHSGVDFEAATPEDIDKVYAELEKQQKRVRNLFRIQDIPE